VVGCGWRNRDGTVFFTKNGKALGLAKVGWCKNSEVWVAVGVKGGAATVKVKFEDFSFGKFRKKI